MTLLAMLVRLYRIKLGGAKNVILIFAFIFASSWLLMSVVEPGNDINLPQNYFWYFIVTSTTVGYGDFFPETGLGHLVGTYIIIGGGAMYLMIFAAFVDWRLNRRERRMSGTVKSENHRGHVVIVGVHGQRTLVVVRELLKSFSGEIVIVAPSDVATRHPLPDEPRVTFYTRNVNRSEELEPLIRNSVCVVVDGRDDNETYVIARMAEKFKPGAHIIPVLEDFERVPQFTELGANIECVFSSSIRQVAEAVCDRGITAFYADAMSAGGDTGTYSLQVGHELAGYTVRQIRGAFEELDCTVIAVGLGETLREGMRSNPPRDLLLRPGMRIFYLGNDRRLEMADVKRALGQLVPAAASA